MTKKVNNIVNSCNEIKELLLWHGEMLRNTNIDYQTRLENDLYFKEKVFKILHRIKRTTWRGEKENYPVMNVDLSKRINTNQTTTANQDVSTIPYY